MSRRKMTALYLRSVSPLLFFIFIFNELSFFLMTFRNTHILPWPHLIQSTLIAVSGYLIFLIPSVYFSRRIGETCTDTNPMPEDLKLMTFLKSMKGLTLCIWLTSFIMIVLPRITGFFFTPEPETLFIFVSRFVMDMVISLILWGISVFLILFFFKAGIGKISDISTVKKYSHLHVRKNFSIGFVLMFGLLQSFLITATFTLSGSSFFAERAIINPAEADPALFALTGAASGILILTLLLLFLRVFRNLQYQKVGRTVALLNEIETPGRGLSRMNIITLDEFGDLCEAINLLTENTQTVAEEFRSETAALHESLYKTGVIYENIKTPLAEITAASCESAESNSQITFLSRSDKNVHNLNTTAKMMEEQIAAQEEMVEQTSVSIGQMSSSIAGIIQTIRTAAQLSDKLKNYSATGNKAIEEARKAIEEIQDAAQSVSEILAVIQRIAGQTNLLSMNASIEAAHAGASGSGFALVAQSVRALADASTKSAKKIENHIGEMTEWIQIGNQTITSITKTFEGIRKGIGENSDLIATISDAMNEEEEAARDTMTAIESVVSSVRNIKEQFQTQKEAAINVEETITLILDLSDRMQQLFATEKEMTERLNKSVESMIRDLNNSRQTLNEIGEASERYAL